MDVNGFTKFLPKALLSQLLVLQGCGGGASSDNPTNTGDTDNSDNPVETISDGYTGSEDQAVLNVSNANVLTVGASAYSVSAKIFDPNHGYIDVTTEIPFTLDCPNESPGTGRLALLALASHRVLLNSSIAMNMW
jgi:hypothetical protein